MGWGRRGQHRSNDLQRKKPTPEHWRRRRLVLCLRVQSYVSVFFCTPELCCFVQARTQEVDLDPEPGLALLHKNPSDVPRFLFTPIMRTY